MAQELKLKTNKEPAWFNKEMAIGGLLGLEIPVVGLFTAIPGAILGGWIGKNRMENEKLHGKPVSDTPSFWNKDTLLGGAMGWITAGFIGVGVAVGIVFAANPGIFSGAFDAAQAPQLIESTFHMSTTALRLATTAIMAGGAVLGAYLGGKHGEKRQMAEYEQAKQQQIVQQLSQNVSPEVGQAVGYRMEHDKQWAKQMLEEKLMAAGQQNTRQ